VGQVNRIPNGFLDLLGVQSLGRNPPLFSDAISPTVDLTEFYSGQTLSSHTEDLTHTAEDDQVVVFVPEGETWFLRAVSFQSAILASTQQYEAWQFTVDNLAREATGGATSEAAVWVSKRVIGQLIVGFRETDAFYLGTPLALTSGTVLKARIIARDTQPARATSLDWLINRFNS